MRLLTVKEVAESLQVSCSLVYQLVESGKLPHHRIGLRRGRIRFTEDDLLHYLGMQRDKNPTKDRRPIRDRKWKHLA